MGGVARVEGVVGWRVVVSLPPLVGVVSPPPPLRRVLVLGGGRAVLLLGVVGVSGGVVWLVVAGLVLEVGVLTGSGNRGT